jgi:RNA polymerase sigma-70 factor (ECF subfamily)
MADKQVAKLSQQLSDDLSATWVQFVDAIEPLRGALHTYCRNLTHSVWDAEDLVQETLLRAFGSMGAGYPKIDNPRAFLFRAATNLWIDTIRKRETAAKHSDDLVEVVTSPQPLGVTRDAGTALFQILSPQERVALILKEVIELSLAEIADILETTPGAVKSSLHRAREKLEQFQDQEQLIQDQEQLRPEVKNMDMSPNRLPSVDLVDRFIAAFNALDLGALTELLLEDVSVEVVGIAASRGRDKATAREGWLQKSMFGHDPAALDAQEPETQQRAERREFLGEPITIFWIDGPDGECVEWLCRLEERDGRIARIVDYCLCPETEREVIQTLDLPQRLWGHRLNDQVWAWEREERQHDV